MRSYPDEQSYWWGRSLDARPVSGESYGQTVENELIIHTGWFKWTDGSIHNEKEPVSSSVRDLNFSTEEHEEEEEEFEVDSSEIVEEEPPTLKNPPRQDHYYDGPVEKNKVA